MTNNGTMIQMTGSWVTGWTRINIVLSTSYTLAKFYTWIATLGSTTFLMYVYGSNSAISYADTSTSTRTTDSNLTLISSSTFNEIGAVNDNQYTYSQDTTNLYKYVHLFFYSVVGYQAYQNYVYTGTITSSNLVNGTYYSIDSDPINGQPRIKNLKSANIQGDCNILAIIWNELSRRLYQVVRDKNTLVLTDGTNTQTLTSTTAVTSTNTTSLTNKTLTDSTNNIMAKSLKSATTMIDVSTSSAPTIGQVLTAINNTSSSWQAPQSVTSLANLTTDVTITSPNYGDVLFYNGTKWINRSTQLITIKDINGIQIEMLSIVNVVT